MTAAACRIALADFLETITGIGDGAGKIYRYRRIIRNEAAVKALLADENGKVNAWMISPAGATTTVTERQPGYRGIGVKGGGQALTTMQWQIEGYYQIDDAAASEETFGDLAALVVQELNSYGTLFAGVTHQLPADIEQFGFIALANFALYHYCRIGVAFRGRTVGG